MEDYTYEITLLKVNEFNEYFNTNAYAIGDGMVSFIYSGSKTISLPVGKTIIKEL